MIGLLLVTMMAQGDGGTSSVAPRNYTTPGGAQTVARKLFIQQRIRQMQEAPCVRIGCLVIVNETRGYDVTGLFLLRDQRGGTERWTPNQFEAPLRPLAAFFTPKAGDGRMCRQPVRFELVQRETGERLKVSATAALCRKEAASSLLRIRVTEPARRVLDPQVTVETPAGAALP